MDKLENHEVELDLDQAIDEETSNAATIAAKPTVSRSALLSMMVDYASKMDQGDLADFVARIPNAEVMTKSNDEIYNNNTSYASGDAGKNKTSIKSGSAPSMPMSSVKEDLSMLFGEDSGLSEDFRIKTEAIFEAAVSTRVALEVANIEETFQATLDEQVDTLREEMEENIDSYLNYAVAQWMEDNKIAVENNLRTEVAESFMEGLKNLFAEHYVDIPADKVDVVESMAARIEELEAAVNEAAEVNVELSKAVVEAEVNQATDELAEGMTDTQKDKFVKLLEAASYSSAQEFRKKASVIKETYFSGKSDMRVSSDQLLSESVDEPETVAQRLEPDMQMYVSSLSRSVKK